MTDKPPAARVFVVHEPLRKVDDPATPDGFRWERVRDLTPALEYGDLVYIFPAGHLSYDQDYLYRTAHDKLSTFTDQDYLLMSGDTLAMAQSAILASQALGDDTRALNMLIWDGRHKRYFSRPIWAWPDEAQVIIPKT